MIFNGQFDNEWERVIYVLLEVLYIATFFVCWILSLMIIKRECETDTEILNSRVKLLEIMVRGYIHKDDYNIINASTRDMSISIRDDYKMYEKEINQHIDELIRVEIETKFEGTFIIRPYFSLKRIIPKKINKDYWL